MTPSEFIIWLSGFAAAMGDDVTLYKSQWDTIKAKLATVSDDTHPSVVCRSHVS